MSDHNMVIESISQSISALITYVYELLQRLVIYLFSPRAPTPTTHLSGPRIAIVGAGITGVSAAAHCVGYGCDVVIFEKRPRHNLGGIWSRVNSTSSLQVYSVMYRFHPSIVWHKGYPNRQRILQEVERLWKRYGLQSKTRFETPVQSLDRDSNGKWVVNRGSDSEEIFDGVIVATGTCGEPSTPNFPGEDSFRGRILHSSDLDGLDISGKKVAVVGGGASAIEAVEYAVQGEAKVINILARSDKWIIPRNVIVDTLLSMNIFGYETSLSFIPEFLLKHFFYRDLQDLAPQNKGLFTSTPMCNNQILSQIRAGKAHWLRGDIDTFEPTGIRFTHRHKGVPPGGPGTKELIESDIIILATGFKRPDPHFLPKKVFEQPYAPPAWYLQTFPPEYPKVCAINSMYTNALGTVGHVHIGLYTRTLLMFLLDPNTAPSSREMKRWIDTTRWLKQRAPGRAFDFFTYSEMILWFVECILWKPQRWSWAAFVFLGWGKSGRVGGKKTNSVNGINGVN